MGWTEIGRIRARESLLRRYGGEEGLTAEMRRRASKGGKHKIEKGFATMDKITLIQVSSYGGSKKRRKHGKKKKDTSKG